MKFKTVDLIVLLTSIVAFIALCGASSPQSTSPAATSTAIAAYMHALVKANHFSGTVLVAKNGRAIWSHGYGQTNLEWNIPNQVDTKFRIASVTKQFTAMAVMILQHRGLLQISDPVCNYIHDCPVPWKPITIRQLLSHTSGIPDYVEFPDYQETQALATTPEDLIKRFRDKPLQCSPGEKFAYSNSGYVLLGVIIEKVSGKSYQDVLRQNIFNVLKMTNTGYDNNAEVLHNRAAGYTKAGSALRNARYIDMSVPYSAGGLYSTVGDLLLWDQALYTEKLVSQRGLDEMFTPQKELVGYGWAISTLFNRKMEHHNGGIDGFDSNIARFPDDKVFIVVLSNVEGTAVDDITKDLAAIVFGEKYKLPAARKIIQLSSAQHNSYVGTYRITADIALTITFENDHLIGELSGGAPTKFELFPESETDFFSEDPPVKIVFAKDRTGAISECTVNGEYTGKKVQQ